MIRTVEVTSVGIRLTPMTADDVVRMLVDEPATAPTLIVNHNLHSLYLFHKLDWFRELYARAKVVVVDGWPILKLLAWSGNGQFGHAYRIGSTDWLDSLRANGSTAEFRVFVLGGTVEAKDRACERLRSGRATIVAEGRSGYFDLDADAADILLEIRRFRPDLVLVGMGMPRQEQFVANNLDQFPDAYLATVGGAIDYLGGAQKLAPRSFGRFGVEWLWRLAADPRRLWRRYLVEPLMLAVLVVTNRVRKTGPWKEVASNAQR